MGYTQLEITAAVNKLLTSSVRYDIDTVTGNRQIDVTFTDVQEAAAATFVMYRAAPMRVAKLSSRRLTVSIQSYLDALTELYDSVLSLRRVDQTSNVLTPLANTTAALTELEGVVRGGKFKNLQSIPSYQRFSKSSANFLTAVKPSVVSDVGGQPDVIQTKQQAMSNIPGTVAGLQPTFDELHQGVVYFSQAIDDYAALNLPSVLAQNVVRRSRQMLQERYDNLSALTVDKQQELLRDATLEMLSAKGVLDSLSSFEPPPVNPPVTGTVAAYADADRPLVSAANVSTKQEPFLIRHAVNDVLHLKIDGTQEFDIELPAIDDTYIEGYLPSPFTFHTGLPARIDNYQHGDYTFATDSSFKMLLEATVSGTYQQWPIDLTIPAGTYTEGAFGFMLALLLLWETGGVFEVVPGTVVLAIRSTASGPNYRVTILDGTANQVLGFATGSSSFGQYRNDQLVVTHTDVGSTSFTVTFPSGMQTAAAVVSTFNAAIPPALAGKVQASVRQYTSAYGSTQEYVRVSLLDTSANASLKVTGTTVPGQKPNSGVGIEGEISHTKLTAQRLADFLNAYEDPGPPVRKLSDYVSVSIVQLPVVYATLTSINKISTSSRIEVSGTAADTLFSTTQQLGIGASRWYVMSDENPALEVGDVIELWDTDTNLATIQSRSDTSLLYTNLWLTCGFVYPFAASGPLHAIALRGDRKSFDQLVAEPAMVSFLSDDHSRFFSELTRSTNSMLSDKNPTEAEINTVLGLLQQHSSELSAIKSLLQQLETYPCGPVDELVRSLNEKGSDKAVDVLLQCRFSTFFGLDVKTSSYAGSIMSGLQTVAQQDLPIVKFDRVKGARSVLATAESVDYETDFSDTVPDNNKYSIDKA